jgi:antitoxin (DNA-binding transcriptional repressor) of toxin-antitoxin stability system
MSRHLGVDLNGLVDQVASIEDGPVRLGQGEIPSVVVVPHSQPPRSRILSTVTGVEATRSFEGRGWAWPAAARSEGVAARIPIADILDRVSTGRPITIRGQDHDPADLVAAAAVGLGAEERGGGPTTLVVRDNGTIDEEAQQRLINGFGRRRMQATLLWRPVAAVLGIEETLNPVADRLHGRTLGVVSVLGDGIDVSVLEIERREDDAGAYVVPVRARPGVRVPFDRPLATCAEDLARALLPDDQDGGRQLVWGGGAAIRAFLNLDPGETLVQVRGRWRLLRFGGAKAGIGLPVVEEDAFEEAKALLVGVRNVIIEGPGMAATAGSLRLRYTICLDLLPKDDRTVIDGWLDDGIVAKGAAIYAARRAMGRTTYFDHLPRLRFAALRGDEPAFIDLIPRDARLEGGEAYDPPPVDLGLWIEAGTTEIRNFLVKETDPSPRVSTVLLDRVPQVRTPVRVKIHQRPLAGLARITLIPDDAEGLRPIELDWARMPVDGRSEEEILDYIATGGRAVPPVAPVGCHAILWTSGSDRWPSLATLLGRGPRTVDGLIHRSRDGLFLMRTVAMRLQRQDSPSRITRGADTDIGRYRAVSSLGDVPADLLAVDDAAISQLDEMLEAATEIAIDERQRTNVRGVALRLASWAFSRCPDRLRARVTGDLLADRPTFSRTLAYQAAGRIATAPEEIRAMFAALARVEQLRLYHLRAALLVLSRAERAAKLITPPEADHLARSALYHIQSARARPPGSHLTSTSIQLIAALLRHRLSNRNFLDPKRTELGAQVRDRLSALSTEKWIVERHRKMAGAALEWVEMRGTDTGILTVDDDEEEDDGTE